MIAGIAPYIPATIDLVALVMTLVIALSFFGLGMLCSPPRAAPESMVVSGWGVALALVTVAGTLFGVAVGWLFFPLLAVGMVVFARRLRRPLPPQARDIGLLIVVGLPLLLVVSAASASQWDEFAHWLANQRYLVDIGMFPRRGLPESTSGFAAYPYGLALVGFGISRLAGGFVENAGALFNTLLIPLLGVSAVRAFHRGSDDGDHSISWTAAAAAVATATLLNPTFVPKLVFTTYADWTTAAVLGIAACTAWHIAEALARGRRHEALDSALPLGLMFTVAISLKQPNVIPVLLLLAGLFLTIAIGLRVRPGDWIHLGVRILLVPLVVYMAWRYHVAQHIPGKEFSFLPVESWLWDDLGAILGRMLLIASKKGGYFGLMLLASGAAVHAVMRAWRGQPLQPIGRLAIIVGTMFVGYNAFLYLAYVGAFGPGEGRSAASYWRYNTQLGGAALIFGTASAGLLWRKLAHRLPRWNWVAPILLALVLVGPLVTARKIRFDLNPVTRYVRAVGVEIGMLTPKGARLVVIDPMDNGKRALLLRYELAGHVRVEIPPAVDTSSPATLEQTLAGAPGTFFWVHVPTPALVAALAVEMLPLSSYLIEVTGAGGRIVRAWPYPGYTHPVAEDD